MASGTRAKPHLLALYFAARGWTLAALLAVLAWSRALSDAPLRWEFLVWVAAAMALRLWAGAHLGPHGNAARAQAPRLVRSGPYRFSRHPLYLANLAAGAGWIFFANSLPPKGTAALLLALALHHAILASWEEARLRETWGEAHAEYRRAVPPWIGLRHARPEPAGTTASWRSALAWQGRNLAYMAFPGILLWIAAGRLP